MMNSVRILALAVMATGLASCSFVFGQPTLDQPHQPIDMKTYTVSAPSGAGWKVQKDLAKGLLVFHQDPPKPTISVVRYGLPGSAQTLDEDHIAGTIFDNEERILRERGASRSYVPSGFTRDHVVVSGKALYVMRYSVAQSGLQVPISPLVMKYAMYLYLPTHRDGHRDAYAFLIGAVAQMGSAVFTPDLAEINSVISTFETR